MVQTLARCRSCGLPSRLAEVLAWEADGTVRARRFRGVRLAVVDHETMARSRDAARAGTDGEGLFAREKEAARNLASLQLRGIKEKISRYGVVKKRVLDAMEDYSSVLGAGRIEMEKFAPGKGGSWMVKAAFDDIMVDAAVAGILEELDACEYERLHEEAGKGTYRLELRATGRAARVSQQAEKEAGAAEVEAMGKDDEEVRCAQCGLPIGLTAFSWNEIYGSMETFPGRLRVAFVPHYVLELMSRAPAAAGGAYPHPLQEAARAAAADRLAHPEEEVFDGAEDFVARTGGAGVGSFLDEKLRLRGWGRVRGFSQDEGGWRLEIENPVDAHLVGGWLQAVFAAALGREALVRAEEEKGAAVFRLS